MFKLLLILILSLFSIGPLAFSEENLAEEVELIPKDVKTRGIGKYTIGSDKLGEEIVVAIKLKGVNCKINNRLYIF